MAEQIDKDIADMEQQSSKLGDRIDDAKAGWEQAKSRSDAPGATSDVEGPLTHHEDSPDARAARFEDTSAAQAAEYGDEEAMAAARFESTEAAQDGERDGSPRAESGEEAPGEDREESEDPAEEMGQE